MALQTYIEDEETYQFTQYQSLAKTDDDNALFERFAYGVYDPKLKLNAKQKKKLIELTIIQLCQNKKKVDFTQIGEVCDLKSVLDIEQLLIEIIQKELILGTIDDKNQCLNIYRCISRDVRQSDIPEMKSKIRKILLRTQQIKAKLK